MVRLFHVYFFFSCPKYFPFLFRVFSFNKFIFCHSCFVLVFICPCTHFFLSFLVYLATARHSIDARAYMYRSTCICKYIYVVCLGEIYVFAYIHTHALMSVSTSVYWIEKYRHDIDSYLNVHVHVHI